MMSLRYCLTRLALGLCLGLMLMSSCSETIDLGLEAQAESEKAFKEYAQKKDYEQIRLHGDFADRYVYMKWEHKATDRSRKPKATDYVRMKYTGRLLKEQYIIDQTDAASVRLLPQMYLPHLVAGMSIGLQNMALGDKATIVMPWFLAYGEGRKGIPPYAALSFDVELLEISSTTN